MAAVALGVTALVACRTAIPSETSPGSFAADRPPTALQRLLAPLDVTPDQLGIRGLHVPRDAWRLGLVDHLLARPIDAVPMVRGAAAELRHSRQSLAGFVRSGSQHLGLSMPVSTQAPTNRSLTDVLWAVRVDGPDAPTRATLGHEVGRLPLPVRRAVADLLHAMALAAPMLGDAFAALTDADRAFLVSALSRVDAEPPTLDETPAWRLLDLAGRVDRPRLLSAATIVAAAVDRARISLERWRRSGKPGLPPTSDSRTSPGLAEGDVLLAVETKLGLVVVGGPGSTTYRRDAALIVDLGGDDRYDNRAGGVVDRRQPISIVIDLDGNDRYVAPGDVAQGTATFGVGILMDLGGDDIYVARSLAQGAGLLGVGILVDRDGDDSYQARAYAQGAGIFGIGALIDARGTDRYRAAAFAQGLGATGGLGVLLDEAGDDRYVLVGGAPDFREPERGQSFGQGFGLGMRPLASGGIGLLVDRGGNDRYEADYFAQGASYWLGLGALVDDAGDDVYVARRYAQGAGIHLSVGVLWDAGGDDAYGSWGVCQGVGHDRAVGILADGGGSDRYVATWLAQGAGSVDGIGLLVDLAGTDRFEASGHYVQGHGSAAQRGQSLGLFVKLGGAGSYVGHGRPGGRWEGAEYGGGLDARDLPLGTDLEPRRPRATLTAFAPTAPAGYPRPTDPRFPPRDETARTVQTLVLRLAEPLETPDAERVRADAKQALRALGVAAVPGLVDLLAATRTSTVLAVMDGLVILGETAHPALIERLSEANWIVRRRAATVLARTATPAIAPALVAAISDADPVVRAALVDAIGRAGAGDWVDIVVEILDRDPDADVRAAAAGALGAVDTEPTRAALGRALGDPAFGVRRAARKSLSAPR